MCQRNGEEQNMKALIVTVAGMARRFSESVGKDTLKCLYYRNSPEESLLCQMLNRKPEFDKYIIVGGFLFDELSDFIGENLKKFSDKIILVKNERFADYGSCYSLYLGIKKAEGLFCEQIVFAEGDLFVDEETFQKVYEAKSDVVTSNGEEIRADRAVVFYYDTMSGIHYIYDTGHETLRIEEPFTAVYNSGQVWKFKNKKLLLEIAEGLSKEELMGTNLVIIQKYFSTPEQEQFQQFRFKTWINCNTLADFERMLEEIR